MRQRLRLWLALAAALLAVCHAGKFDAPPAAARVGVRGIDQPPFLSWANSTDTGMEAALREALCTLANLECELVVLPEPDGRIAALQSGEVDFVISMFSVTPNRSELVDFVHPFYYDAGVALYALKQNHQLIYESGGWDGLQGRPICMFATYYAKAEIVKRYAVEPVYFSSTAEGLQLVNEGKCDAIAADSSTQTYQQGDVSQVASVQPVLTAPYGVAVQKGDTGLADRLSAALVRVMSEGQDSPMLQWEEEYVLGAGIPSNPNLLTVVDALSYFDTLS